MRPVYNNVILGVFLEKDINSKHRDVDTSLQMVIKVKVNAFGDYSTGDGVVVAAAAVAAMSCDRTWYW